MSTNRSLLTRCTVLAGLLLCVGAVSASAATNLLPNGDFESGATGGWSPDSATLASVAPGNAGSGFGLRATVGGAATRYGLHATAAPVKKATVRGSVYTADGFVRSDTPGKQVCLQLVEVDSAGTQVATPKECAIATASYAAFPTLTYTATTSGGSLKLKVFQRAAVAGDSFQVDDLSLATQTTGAPPEAPTGLAVGTVTTSSVSLSWAASATTNVTYRVARNGVVVSPPSLADTTFTDTGLDPLTSYTYTVKAVDASTPPLESADSSAVTATTLAATGGGLSDLPDLTWMTNGRVDAVATDGTYLYVGGKFTQVRNADGVKQYTADNLARFSLADGSGVPWGASVTESAKVTAPEVRALAVSSDGSTVFVGGTFDTVDGGAHKNFAAVSASTGAIDPSFDVTAASTVHVILATASKVYLGGAFPRINGKVRSRLAALLPDGTLDPDWQPTADAVVRSLLLAPDGDSMFVGGAFTTMDGQPRQSVARVSLDTGALDPWAIPAGTIENPQSGWRMAANATTLFVGFGVDKNYAAAFHLDTGDVGGQLWRWKTIGNVEGVTLSPSGDRVIFSGHFGTNKAQRIDCGTNLRGLISLNPATGEEICDWVPQLTPFGANATGAWTVVTVGTQLWVGGRFDTIGGATHENLARFTF